MALSPLLPLSCFFELSGVTKIKNERHSRCIRTPLDGSYRYFRKPLLLSSPEAWDIFLGDLRNRKVYTNIALYYPLSSKTLVYLTSGDERGESTEDAAVIIDAIRDLKRKLREREIASEPEQDEQEPKP